MKTLIITILCCISTIVSAQGNYEQSMKQALDYWKSNESQKAIAQFERISQVEKNNWIPTYYQAMILTTSAFQENDIQKKSKLIESSASLLNDKNQDNNSEWLVLKAMNRIAELTIDPMTKARELSPEIIALYKKAIALKPENPRAILGMAEFEMNTKKYFNQETSKECEAIQKALSLFSNEKPSVLFAPSWGKDRAEQIVKDCK